MQQETESCRATRRSPTRHGSKTHTRPATACRTNLIGPAIFHEQTPFVIRNVHVIWVLLRGHPVQPRPFRHVPVLKLDVAAHPRCFRPVGARSHGFPQRFQRLVLDRHRGPQAAKPASAADQRRNQAESSAQQLQSSSRRSTEKEVWLLPAGSAVRMRDHHHEGT